MIKDIVGYKYATQMSASLIIETVHAAEKVAKPTEELILYSDNGFQYTSLPYYNVAGVHKKCLLDRGHHIELSCFLDSQRGRMEAI